MRSFFVSATAIAVVAALGAAALAQPGVAPVRKSITVNGLNLSYLQWGSDDAPPMLLFPGAGAVSAGWEGVAPAFAKHYRVISFDMRGQGFSDWDPNKQYNVMTHVADMKEAVHQLGLKNIILLGHSQGGNEAVVYAAEDAENVIALIAEDGGYMLPGSTHADRRARDALAGIPPRPASKTEFATWDEVIASLMFLPPEVRKLEAENLFRKTDDGHYVARADPSLTAIEEADSMMQPGATAPFAKRVKCPTMVIRGMNDDAFVMEATLTLASLIQDTRLIVLVPGAGHGLHEMKPAEFIAAVQGFLELVEPAQ
jgi:pimeloyl-ACP methyl ester carboxylesterase